MTAPVIIPSLRRLTMSRSGDGACGEFCCLRAWIDYVAMFKPWQDLDLAPRKRRRRLDG